MNRKEQLIQILLDRTATVSERDDAALDLAEISDERALNALLAVVRNINDEPFIMDVCGESIAQIWIKMNRFDNNIINSFHPLARSSTLGYIEEIKPELMKSFNEKSDIE